MSGSNCCFLTSIQVSQETDKIGKVVWYFHIFNNFPQFVLIHTVRSFIVVNEAEVDVFLEFSCFFYVAIGCWQVDLWFLFLFYIQLEYLEVLDSCTIEA